MQHIQVVECQLLKMYTFFLTCWHLAYILFWRCSIPLSPCRKICNGSASTDKVSWLWSVDVGGWVGGWVGIKNHQPYLMKLWYPVNLLRGTMQLFSPSKIRMQKFFCCSTPKCSAFWCKDSGVVALPNSPITPLVSWHFPLIRTMSLSVLSTIVLSTCKYCLQTFSQQHL